MQYITRETHHSNCPFRWGPPIVSNSLYINDLLFVSFPSMVYPFKTSQDHVGPNPHALPRDLYVLVVESHPKPFNFFLPLLFPTPPTLNVHSQHYPCVFVDDVGDADSGDDFQQIGGNPSIKSSHTLLGHDVVKQGQHGRFRVSLHRSWRQRERWAPLTDSGFSLHDSTKLRPYGVNGKKSCLLLIVSLV